MSAILKPHGPIPVTLEGQGGREQQGHLARSGGGDVLPPVHRVAFRRRAPAGKSASSSRSKTMASRRSRTASRPRTLVTSSMPQASGPWRPRALRPLCLAAVAGASATAPGAGPVALSSLLWEGDSMNGALRRILISAPAIDFRTFIGLSHKVLGRSPAAPSDACRRELSDAERFLSCLAAMRDERAPVGLSPHLLQHVSFSAFIGADERDMLEILQLCAGMPFVAVETIVRGVQAAVVTGTLDQWKDAVVSGCSKASTLRPALLQQAARPVHCRRPECLGRLHAPQHTGPDFFVLEDKQRPVSVQFRPWLAIY